MRRTFKKLPEDLKDAYFQLILYPVRSSTLNLEQYIAADRSALYALQNRGKAVNMEAARSELALEMHREILTITTSKCLTVNGVISLTRILTSITIISLTMLGWRK